MLRRRLNLTVCVAFAISLWAPAGAHATALFDIIDGTLTYRADTSISAIDQVAIFDTGTHYRFVRFGAGDQPGDGAGCSLIDQNTVDCLKSGVNEARLILGDNNDVASVSASVKIPVIFDGGPGNDGLFGGGGQATFIGGAWGGHKLIPDGRPGA